MGQNKRTWWRLLCLTASVALFVTACDSGDEGEGEANNTTTPVTEEGQVRALHLSPDAPSVDIFVNDGSEAALRSLSFAQSTGFVDVEAGQTTFQIAPAGGSAQDAVLRAGPVPVVKDGSYTAVAYGELVSIEALVLEENLTLPGGGQVRVRFVHTAQDVGQVDVWNITDPQNPSPLYEDVDFGVAGDATEIPAAAYTLGVDVDNDQTPDLIFELPTLPAGESINLFAASDDQGVFLLAQDSNGNTTRIDPASIEEPPIDESQVRVIHLSPGAPSVDVFANDARAVQSLAFPDSTDFLTVAAGTYDFTVVAAGDDQANAVGSANGLSLDIDKGYTAFAFGDVADLQVSAFEDDTAPPTGGNIRVRAIHAAQGVGQVDIWNITDPENPAPLYEDVDFGVIGGAAEIPAGAYTLGIDVDNDANPDLVFNTPDLAAGTVVNLFAAADDNGAFLIAQFGDSTTARIDPTPIVDPPVEEATVRVIHLSPDAPGVDVFANDARAIEGLAYPDSTGFLTVPAAEYDFTVVAAGADIADSVGALNATLAADTEYTAFAFGTLANLEVSAFADDTTDPADGNIRVRAIHAAEGVGQVDIWNITDPENPAALYEDVDFGVAGDSTEIPAGAYTLGIDVDNDANPDLVFNTPDLAAGTVVNLFAVADDNGAFLIAQFGDSTTARIDPTVIVDPPVEEASVRVIHLSPDAPGVDVFANDARAIEGLAYPDSTGFLTVPAAEYDFTVVAAGADIADSVGALNATLAADTEYTAFAFGTLANLEVSAFADDTTDPADGNIRVRAIHAAEGVGQVDIWNITDPENPAALYEDVDFGVAGDSTEIPAGAYTLGIDIDNDANPDLVFNTPDLAAGTVVNLFAVADDNGAFLIAQFGDSTTARIDPTVIVDPPVEEATVRVIHLSPDAPGVDVFANEARAIEGLAYPDSTDFLTVPAAEYDFTVVAAGADIADSVGALNATLAADTEYTAFAFGTLANLEVSAFADDTTDPADGNIRVRAIHAAEGVGQVDIWNITDLENPAPLYEDVDFGVAGDALEIPAGAYTLGIDVDNDANPDLVFNTPDLAAGTVVNLFAVADDDGAFLIAQFGDSTTARIDPTVIVDPPVEEASLRVIHLSPDAPGVDVFANDARAIEGLAYPDSTGFLTVPAAEYDFTVVAAGADIADSVGALNATLAADTEYTAFAFGTLANLEVSAFADDTTAPADGNIRVRAIHAAEGVGQVDIWNITDLENPAPLYEAVDFGVAGDALEIPAGAYTLGIDVDNDANPDLVFNTPDLAAGTVVNLFAVADDNGAFLIAQFGDSTTARIDPTPIVDPPVEEATVRVIHLSPDAPGVDVFANDARAIEGLMYPDSTDFLTVPAAEYNFTVVAAGADIADSVGALNATLAADTEYTAFAFGTLANLEVSAFADDTTDPADGNIRVRAIHAAEGVGQVDIWNITDLENPAPLYEDVDFGVAGDALEIPAGAYTLGIDVDNDANPDLVFNTPDLAAGTVVNLFAVADDNGAFLIAQFGDSTTARIDPTPIIEPMEDARIRALHLSPNTPIVDVLAGGAPLFEGIRFPNGVDYATVPAAAYDIDIVPAGGGEPFLSIGGLELMDDTDYTAVAYNTRSDLRVLPLVDDLTAPADGNIRVRAVHVAFSVGQVDIWNFTDPQNPTPLYEDVDYGTAGDALEIPAGAYTLAIDRDNDANPEFIFDLPELPAGTIANLFAVARGSDFYLLAQFSDSTTARIDPRQVEPPVEEASLRVIHLSPDAPEIVDVFANDVRAIDGLPFNGSTESLTVPATSYTFSVVPPGEDLSQTAGELDVTLAADTEYTAFAFGNVADLQVGAFVDDTTAPADGNIRVRAIHAAVGVGQVDIWNFTDPQNPSPLYEDVDFGVAGDALEIPAGAYTLAIDVDNDANPEFIFETPELEAGTVVNLFAVLNDTGVKLVAQFSDSSTAVLNAANSIVRVMHLSPGVPPVDLFADGVLAFNDLMFSMGTPALHLPSGSRDFQILPQGFNNSVDLDNIFLPVGANLTVAAFNTPFALDFLFLNDDVSPVADGNLRVRAIHTAVGVPAVDIWDFTDPNSPSRLYDDLAFGTAGDYLEIPPGTYRLAVDTDNDAVPELVFNVADLPAGEVVNLFAVSENDAAFLVAQFNDGTTARINPEQ